MTLASILLALAFLPMPQEGADDEMAESAQTKPPLVSNPETKDARSTLMSILAQEDIALDPEAGTVSWPMVVLRDVPNAGYPIEFIAVTNGGRTHETVFLTRVTPSLINACFLALGLTPGRTIRFVPKDPPPSEEDLLSGKEIPFEIVPPAGPVVFLYVRWTDEEGNVQTRAVEDLMKDHRTGQAMPVRGFVYVGSRFARTLLGGKLKEAFMADLEGNIAAIYLRGDGNTLLDINSEDGFNDDFIDVDPETMPKRETLVTMIASLKPLEGQRPPVEGVVWSESHLDVLALAKKSKHPALTEGSARLPSFKGLNYAQIAARALEDESELDRRIGCALLGATGSPGASKPLLDVLRGDKASSVQTAAARALQELATYEAIRGLIEVLSEEGTAASAIAHTALVAFAGEDVGKERIEWNRWVDDHIDQFR